MNDNIDEAQAWADFENDNNVEEAKAWATFESNEKFKADYKEADNFITSINSPKTKSFDYNASLRAKIEESHVAYESLNVDIDTTHYDTSTPEKLQSVNESIKLERIRSVLEAKDDRKYTNDDELKTRFMKDTGYSNVDQAMKAYQDTYAPTEYNPLEVNTIKTSDPWYKHVGFGAKQSINSGLNGLYRNIVEGTKYLKETEVAIRDVDDPQWSQSLSQWTEGLYDDVINYMEPVAEFSELRQEHTEAPEGDGFGSAVLQGLGQAGVTIPLTIANPKAAFINAYNMMYNEGYMQTKDHDLAVKYGIIAGSLEFLTDKLSSTPMAKLDKSNVILKVLGKAGLTFGTGGGTEAVQYALLQKLDGEEIDNKEMLNNFLVGGVVEAITGASVDGISLAAPKVLQTAVNYNESVKTKQVNKELQSTLQGDIDNAIASINEDPAIDIETGLIIDDVVNTENETTNDIELNIERRMAKLVLLKTLKESQIRIANGSPIVIEDIESAINNVAELQDQTLHTVTGKFNKPLMKDEMGDITRSFSMEEFDKAIASSDAESIKMFQDAGAGDDISTKSYNNSIILSNIDTKIGNGEKLTPTEKTIQANRVEHEFKASLPDDADLQGINRAVASKTATSWVGRSVGHVAHTSLLKLYPKLANRVRKYESDINTNFFESHSKVKKVTEALKILDVVGLSNMSTETLGDISTRIDSDKLETALGNDYNSDASIDIVIRDIIDDISVKTFAGDFDGIVDNVVKLTDVVNVMTQAYGYNLEFNIDGKRTDGQLLSDEDIKNLDGDDIFIVRDPEFTGTRLPKKADAQFRRMFSAIHDLGVFDMNEIKTLLDDASKLLSKDNVANYFPREVTDVDSLRVFIEMNDIPMGTDRATLKTDVNKALQGGGTTDVRSVLEVTKDLLPFYENPAISLENYLMAVGRAQAKKDFLNIKDDSDTKLVDEDENGNIQDSEISKEDIGTLLEETLGAIPKRQKEVDNIIKHVIDIMTPMQSSNAIKIWRRLASVKYVTGVSTVFKQYVDLATTIGELIQYGGVRDAKFISTSMNDMLTGWDTESDIESNPKNFLELFGAEMTEPDIDKADIGVGWSPKAWIDEAGGVINDFKLNKSYSKSMIDTINQLEKNMKGDDLIAIKDIKNSLTNGERIAKITPMFELVEAISLTGLRMGDKFNRLKSLSGRIAQVNDMITSTNTKRNDAGFKMINDITGDVDITNQVIEDFKTKKLSEHVKAVLYSMLADRQPLGVAESSDLFRGPEWTKPFGFFTSFKFKSAARFADMCIVPSTQAHYSNKIAKTYNTEVKRLDIEIENATRAKEELINKIEDEGGKVIAGAKHDKIIQEATESRDKAKIRAEHATKLKISSIKKAGIGFSFFAMFTALPNVLMNMALKGAWNAAVVGIKGYSDEDGDNLFVELGEELWNNISPFVPAHNIEKALKFKRVEYLLEGMTQAPMFLGANAAWQIIAGIADPDDGVDYDAMLEDLPMGGRYLQDFIDED